MSPNTIPPLTAAEAAQLEIMLLPDGRTTIREREPIVTLPEWPSDDFYSEELGLFLALSVGDEFTFRVRIWRPRSDAKTGGHILLKIDSGCDCSEHLWAKDMAVALAFLRNQAPLIQCGMLRELIDLYTEARADSDGAVRGFRNRTDEALSKWRKRKAS